MNGSARATLPDGRLHLQHGPIDLVIEAWGEHTEVTRAYDQAWQRFQDILETLVAELPTTRVNKDTGISAAVVVRATRLPEMAGRLAL